jgi:tetratricopeptide (TPR) repeat protein
MKTRVVFIGALMVLLASFSSMAQSEREMLERADRDIRALRYSDAESTLAVLTRTAHGSRLGESLYMLAGLKSSATDASRLYRRIIDEDPGGEWAALANLELSKIQYALGNYEESFRILVDSRACADSDEACLFQGLSAIMLERYADARSPLGSIRKGKLRTWAYLSMAEVESGLNRPEQACSRYESLAGAMIIPTALYRHGECLENKGDVEGAETEYRQIINNFRDTPEAVLAAEKLSRLAERTETPPTSQKTDSVDAQALPPPEDFKSGFTIQFGSFRDRGNAIKLSARIKRVYPGVRVDSELINYREHHRVRYGYYRTREEALAKAEEISHEIGEDYTIMTRLLRDFLRGRRGAVIDAEYCPHHAG